MNKREKNTSLKVASKIMERLDVADVDIERPVSKSYWVNVYIEGSAGKGYWELLTEEEIKNTKLNTADKISSYDILNEICCEHAKFFFGEKEIERKTDDELLGRDDEDNFDNTDFEWIRRVEVTKKILYLLQQGKKQEAENCILKNLIF